MANITLSGTLLDPNSGFAARDKIRFTHKTTTGSTLKGSVSTLVIGADGAYSIDLQYGLVLVERRDSTKSQYINLGVVTVNADNPATTLPELLSATVPVSSEELIEFQSILADCVAAQLAAEAAAADAAAEAAELGTNTGASLVGTSSGITVQESLDALTEGQTGGVIVFATYALLDAYTPQNATEEKSSFKVTNDSNSALNGYYSWVSGTAYTKDADLVINVIEEDNTSDAVSGAAVYDYGAAKDMLDVAPVVAANSRVITINGIPGWSYSGNFAADRAFDMIDVQGGIEYVFTGATGVWANNNRLFFLNGDGQALSNLNNGNTFETFITPIDCKKIVFGMQTSAFTSDLRLTQLTPQSDGYKQKTQKVTGVNLTDGSYYANTGFEESNGVFGLRANTSSALTNVIDVVEGETYYAYGNLGLGGASSFYLMDENDVGLGIFASDFLPYATSDQYLPFTVPVGIGAKKMMVRVAISIGSVTDVINGLRKWYVVDEPNHNLMRDLPLGTYDQLTATEVNQIVDARQPFKKTFYDKSLMIMGDSVYATQTNAPEAYASGAVGVRTVSNQDDNKLFGGACSDIVRRLRPNFWTNYSNGGWTLTYPGTFFGQDIYTNNQSGNFLYNLEKFIFDYDNYIADPITYEKRVAPDVFMIVSSINDFSNPIEAWATDSEIAASGLSYDDYMEQTFVSSGVQNDTLIPLEDVDLNKIGGALRYVIERIYLKFPKCYIVAITSNKTSNHSREGQYKCTRDFTWIANRFNAQLIDVFNNGSQLNMLKEFKDSVTGTRDDLYLTVDGIHDYGSTGKGYQRHGRFICNELIKGYFDLSDFIQ